MQVLLRTPHKGEQPPPPKLIHTPALQILKRLPPWNYINTPGLKKQGKQRDSLPSSLAHLVAILKIQPPTQVSLSNQNRADFRDVLALLGYLGLCRQRCHARGRGGPGGRRA